MARPKKIWETTERARIGQKVDGRSTNSHAKIPVAMKRRIANRRFGARSANVLPAGVANTRTR
jgi:hypothetical protein